MCIYNIYICKLYLYILIYIDRYRGRYNVMYLYSICIVHNDIDRWMDSNSNYLGQVSVFLFDISVGLSHLSHNLQS